MDRGQLQQSATVRPLDGREPRGGTPFADARGKRALAHPAGRAALASGSGIGYDPPNDNGQQGAYDMLRAIFLLALATAMLAPGWIIATAAGL